MGILVAYMSEISFPVIEGRQIGFLITDTSEISF